MKRLLMIVALILLFAPFVFGLPHTNTYKAVWDANTESDLAGYYLYWRISTGTYTDANRIDCGINPEQSLDSVPNDTILVVTAYDESLNESGYSTEVNFTGDSTSPAVPGGLQIIAE